MIRKVLIVASFSLALSASALAGVDNEWLTQSYGAPGDTVIEDVLAQISDYGDAKTRAVAIQKGDREGNLRDAQQKCIDYALYSYVQAMYAAEMGRVAALKGDTATAIEDYKKAAVYANRALHVNHTDSTLGKTSKQLGKKFKGIAQRALKRLGG